MSIQKQLKYPEHAGRLYQRVTARVKEGVIELPQALLQIVDSC